MKLPAQLNDGVEKKARVGRVVKAAALSLWMGSVHVSQVEGNCKRSTETLVQELEDHGQLIRKEVI